MPTTTTAWQLGPFTKLDDANPILRAKPDSTFYCPVRGDVVEWEAKDVFNPCAVVRDGKVFLIYRAEDRVGRHAGTSRLGLAVSDDGVHFRRHGSPVLYPDRDAFQQWEWEGGVEDPRIVEDDRGTYYLTYNAFNGNVMSGRQCLATSRDLLHWQKHGVIGGIDGELQNGTGYKSGVILSQRVGDRLVAARVNGRYWMYWGVETLRLAVSDDLIRWERVLDDDGHELTVLAPRPDDRFKHTDNMAVEGGAAALLTHHGIVVLYNGICNPLPPDQRTPTPDGGRVGNRWVGVQALFDADDPARLLDRDDDPFVRPERSYETDGQVARVTFIEGLVHHRGRWLLYYGTADSCIAVAAATTGQDA
ncbi:MAG: glycoside hydrolase family 130 protein [Planctomycetota bacterium]